jgi:hypothetical protein
MSTPATKKMSLSSWPADFIAQQVGRDLPGRTRYVADALTDPSPTLAPAGVVKVTVFA